MQRPSEREKITFIQQGHIKLIKTVIVLLKGAIVSALGINLLKIQYCFD